MFVVGNGGAYAPVVTFLIVPGRYMLGVVRGGHLCDHVITAPPSVSRNVERDPPSLRAAAASLEGQGSRPVVARGATVAPCFLLALYVRGIYKTCVTGRCVHGTTTKPNRVCCGRKYNLAARKPRRRALATVHRGRFACGAFHLMSGAGSAGHWLFGQAGGVHTANLDLPTLWFATFAS